MEHAATSPDHACCAAWLGARPGARTSGWRARETNKLSGRAPCWASRMRTERGAGRRHARARRGPPQAAPRSWSSSHALKLIPAAESAHVHLRTKNEKQVRRMRCKLASGAQPAYLQSRRTCSQSAACGVIQQNAKTEPAYMRLRKTFSRSAVCAVINICSWTSIRALAQNLQQNRRACRHYMQPNQHTSTHAFAQNLQPVRHMRC